MLLILKNGALDEISYNSFLSLIESFKEENLENIALEYDQIFHAPPNPVRATVSFYDEGYESGVACAKVKNILLKTDFRKDENYRDNEDNFGFLFVVMSRLISKASSGDSESEELCEELFSNFISPYIDDFLNAIYTHQKSNAYKDIVNIMSSFFSFERVYYGISNEKAGTNIKVVDGISRSEFARRMANKARKQGAKNAK